jgi:hypothetical protein
MPDPEPPKFDGRIFGIVWGVMSLIFCGLMFLCFDAPGNFLGGILLFLGLPLAIAAFIGPWIGIVSVSMSRKGGLAITAIGVILNIVAILAFFASLLFFAAQMFPTH